jgi:hypothetical protein
MPSSWRMALAAALISTKPSNKNDPEILVP